MKAVDRPLLVVAVVLLAGGILLALSFQNPLMRYGIGISVFALGLGLLRRAFRVE